MFKTNPLPVFQYSTSPIARHALARWGKLPPASWTPAPQRPDGSWNGSVHDTIQELYAAWLAGAAPDERAERGLGWLLESGCPPLRCQKADGASYNDLFFSMGRGESARLRTMTGTPFGAVCSGFVKSGAALFLALGLGLGGEERVTRAFETIEQIPAKRKGWWCSASCGSNLFQAYALRPGPALSLVLGYLAERQGNDGAWAGGVPFYPTFNALSRLADSRAAAMFERALPKVRGSQMADGGWGRSDRELKTFLVLDAMERTGIAVGV